MNKLTITPGRLSRLPTICLTLPEAPEKEAWGDPTWRVRGRIFAMQKGNYEGGRPSLWLKASKGCQSIIVASGPDRFFVPPYVGHKGWIGVYLDGWRIDWDELNALVRRSYQLVAAKRASARALS